MGEEAQKSKGQAQGSEGLGEQEAGAEESQVDLRIQQLEAKLELTEKQRARLEGRFEKEIARQRQEGENREKALRTFVRGRMEEAGATSEELTKFEGEYGRFAEGLSEKEKAERFDDLVAVREEKREVRAYQERYIAQVGKGLGVEIPLNHPDLKADPDKYDPDEFEDSVFEVGQKLAAEKAAKGEKDALTKAAEAGALASLGAGAGGKANPLAGITDPTELLKMGFEKRKKK